MGSFTFDNSTKIWLEKDTESPPMEFEEVNRNSTSIFLKSINNDPEINIQLDLNESKVLKNGEELFYITQIQ